MGTVIVKQPKAKCAFLGALGGPDESVDYCKDAERALDGKCAECADCASKVFVCPTCDTELEATSWGMDASGETMLYLFCPHCNDWAYDEQGNTVVRLT